MQQTHANCINNTLQINNLHLYRQGHGMWQVNNPNQPASLKEYVNYLHVQSRHTHLRFTVCLPYPPYKMAIGGLALQIQINFEAVLSPVREKQSPITKKQSKHKGFLLLSYSQYLRQRVFLYKLTALYAARVAFKGNTVMSMREVRFPVPANHTFGRSKSLYLNTLCLKNRRSSSPVLLC